MTSQAAEKRRSIGARREKRFIALFGWLFLAAGAALIAGAIAAADETSRFREIALPAKAVIVGFQPLKAGEKIPYPIVRFDAQGSAGEAKRAVTAPLTSTTGGLELGGSLDVWYDPANPADVRTAVDFGLAGGLAFMGGAFVFMGGSFIWLRRLKNERLRRLYSSGIRYDARVVAMEEDDDQFEGGMHPLILTLEADGPGGKKLRFRSGAVWMRPEELDLEKCAHVYVDVFGPRNYAVDVEPLRRTPGTPSGEDFVV